ncbi:hypothetical protein HYS94_00170 [Candidatus Daviesbacteria bacterium]|nr:hypothetical protein [Candidatus Daviesbacteria bacterium]
MKYDSQLVELKNLLPNAKNVLIALPAGADIDKLASALSLFLVLNAQGKEVTVVSDDIPTVSQAHLFGIDHIQKNLPSGVGGNLTLTLEGVAASDGTVPALEKLDWFAEGANLNLVFHVLPGQTFQPAGIIPKYQGSGFNLIFVIGAANLDSLGSVYRSNTQAFSGVHIVNIDNQNNTSFGQTNVVDTTASSVSEVMTNLMSDLGLNLDADSASNLLVGIFEATANLTQKATADTYMVVANLLRAGGKKPGTIVGAQPVSQPVFPTQPGGLDLSALIPKEPFAQPTAEYTTPPVVPVDTQSSPEERPMEEGVISETPEPDWLTPKIFKGTSIG